jgi:cell cycle protein kinase DBF2
MSPDEPVAAGNTIRLQCIPNADINAIPPESKAKAAQCREQMFSHYERISDFMNSRQRRVDEFVLRMKRGDYAKLGPIEKSDVAREFRKTQQMELRRRRIKPRLKDYDLVTVLGQGGFGKVYLARNIATHELVALKKMAKSFIRESNKVASVATERDVLLETREGKGVAKGAHAWLVRLLASFQDSLYLYFVMEYCSGGDLKMLLENRGLDEAETRVYVAEMVAAVSTLHAMGFVHRGKEKKKKNKEKQIVFFFFFFFFLLTLFSSFPFLPKKDLKPDNFLLDSTGHLKLADFGLSRAGVVSKAPAVTPVRVYLGDASHKTLALKSSDTTLAVVRLMLKKLLIDDPKCEYQLHVQVVGQPGKRERERKREGRGKKKFFFFFCDAFF